MVDDAGHSSYCTALHSNISSVCAQPITPLSPCLLAALLPHATLQLQQERGRSDEAIAAATNQAQQQERLQQRLRQQEAALEAAQRRADEAEAVQHAAAQQVCGSPGLVGRLAVGLRLTSRMGLPSASCLRQGAASAPFWFSPAVLCCAALRCVVPRACAAAGGGAA